MSEEKNLKAHLFICTNAREKGESCGQKGSAELRDQVKRICKEKQLKGVRINASGCLGHCEEGITAVLYPQGKWFTELKKDDANKLVSAVEDTLRS
jgi:predicted metal-binding protein